MLVVAALVGTYFLGGRYTTVNDGDVGFYVVDRLTGQVRLCGVHTIRSGDQMSRMRCVILDTVDWPKSAGSK
jgi:hypothetical protein